MARACNSVAPKPDTVAVAFERPDDEKVGMVVKQLRQICRDSSLQFALKVGAVVIHNFYDGQVAAWRSHGPKAYSFRRLAEHPDLPMSPSALCRSVAIFELCQRLNAPSRWRKLGLSHFRAVLGLDPELQDTLLTAANQQHWSVKRLSATALECRNGQARKGGRKPMSALAKNLNSIQRSLNGCRVDLERASSPLAPDEVEQSALLLMRTRQALDELASALERRREHGPARLRHHDSRRHDVVGANRRTAGSRA